MVEVFKTNVTDRDHANMLIDEIHKIFMGHEANFDLEDCDNILRVKCISGIVQTNLLMRILKEFGFEAEVLPDDLKPLRHHKINLLKYPVLLFNNLNN